MISDVFSKKFWLVFLSIALLAGILLRMTCVHDMEYKEDEEYNYTQSMLIKQTGQWPWVGMPSGVYLANPGASVWTFAALAIATGADSPTDLAYAVQGFALLGILLLIVFARYMVPLTQRWLWYGAAALAFVNPFAILYHRKLWPEPLLLFFSVLVLMGWWRRERWGYALLWGLAGAFIGQIHMSGFFFAAGIVLWSLLWKPLDETRQIHWKGWFLGSVLGSLPLIPWAWYGYTHPVHNKISGGWDLLVQFKYWAFWVTDPTGLHLGNPLGLLRGQSNLSQIEDFVRYPLLNGQPTYLNALAHALLFGLSVLIIAGALLYCARALIRAHKAKALLGWIRVWLIGKGSQEAFVRNAVLLGSGLLMTATFVNIRRYYLCVTFPFEFVWLLSCAALVFKSGKNFKRVLLSVWLLQAFISACFVIYIHQNEGSRWGDYGDAYHKIMKERAKMTAPQN